MSLTPVQEALAHAEGMVACIKCLSAFIQLSADQFSAEKYFAFDSASGCAICGGDDCKTKGLTGKVNFGEGRTLHQCAAPHTEHAMKL
mmetsp:Transcript_60478/g.159001  ORF Transcript_60478/g.159001 Transcript_60478/m.159001 type:complete len:88 (+) Transcript_60478:179-442(+)